MIPEDNNYGLCTDTMRKRYGKKHSSATSTRALILYALMDSFRQPINARFKMLNRRKQPGAVEGGKLGKCIY